MKKLFTMKREENESSIGVEEEGLVYSVFNWKTHKTRFVDCQGNTLEHYQRPSLEESEIDREYEEWEEDSGDEEGTLRFNQYGVACADGCLVDAEGNPIPDTELNCEDECSGWNRYFVFTMLTEEQCKSIDKCGTADDITLNYYDTKTRVYALRNIPECRLSTNCFDGEPEVVQEAATLLKEYDSVAIHKKGTIVGNKGKEITVYDYYQS